MQPIYITKRKITNNTNNPRVIYFTDTHFTPDET